MCTLDSHKRLKRVGSESGRPQHPAGEGEDGFVTTPQEPSLSPPMNTTTPTIITIIAKKEEKQIYQLKILKKKNNLKKIVTI
jgi:hypothetical protein